MSMVISILLFPIEISFYLILPRNMRADVYSAKKKYRNLQDPYSNQYQNNMDKYQRYGSYNNPRSNYQQNAP